MINIVKIKNFYLYPMCKQVNILLDNEFTPKKVKNDISNGILYILYDKDIVIGVAKIIDDEIKNFIIDINYRRHKYGTILIKTIMQNTKYLSVIVSKKNEQFIKFLNKFGFTLYKQTNINYYFIYSCND